MLAAVVFTACQDDMEQAGNNVKEGLPAKLNLSFSVPSGDKIVNSRAINDYESEITELALVMYEQTSNRQEIVEISSSDLVVNSIDNVKAGGRTYNLSTDIETLSGNYNIYAIANYSSPFCNLSINDFSGITEEALQELLAENTSNVYVLTSTQRLPMSKLHEDVEIKSTEESASGNNLSLSLQRLTAHIEFIFKNGGEVEGATDEVKAENPKFTPSSYKIYNLPKKAYLLSQSEGNKIADAAFFNKPTSINTDGKNSFDFFMLENVRDVNDKINGEGKYHLRDKWEGYDDNGLKNFTNASENSTYVVVTGEYSGASSFGEVSYTIHLGNFEDNVTFGNFTVNRNEYHTYTITVNGAESIKTESNVNNPDVQSGAEGTLTAIADNQFVLDSHYETVMLAIPKSSNLLSKTQLILKTPYSVTTDPIDLSEVTDGNLQDYDYKWVQFMQTTSKTAFPEYSSEDAIYVDKLAKELADSNSEFISSCYNDDKYYYIAAFIDEYYYDGTNGFGADNDWTKFVNTDNRILILNPDVQISADGNSEYYPNYLFSLSQRSIKTTYPLDKNTYAFGIETWNESGTHAPSENAINSVDNTELTINDGYSNTRLFRNSHYNTEDGIDFTQLGYFNNITDNSKESHIYPNDIVDDFVKGCLSRNRDTNGNGKIDDDELKWYVPSLYQYLVLWMGEDLLTEDTKLFDSSLFAEWTTLAQVQGGPHMYTSSGFSERLYWASQGISWNSTSSGMEASDKGSHDFRCVRDLKQIGTYDLPVRVSQTDATIIEVGNVQKKRTVSMIGEYGKHNERSESNNLPESFQIADDLITGANWGNVASYSNVLDYENDYEKLVHQVTCASYTQDEDGLDIGEWRIPNQRELMAMFLLDKTKDTSGNYQYLVSSTWYSVKFRPGPFAAGNNMYIENRTETANANIRCIRDGIYATSTNTDTDTETNTNGYSATPSYEDGGNVF